jgi:hypothetical protein
MRTADPTADPTAARLAIERIAEPHRWRARRSAGGSQPLDWDRQSRGRAEPSRCPRRPVGRLRSDSPRARQPRFAEAGRPLRGLRATRRRQYAAATIALGPSAAHPWAARRTLRDFVAATPKRAASLRCRGSGVRVAARHALAGARSRLSAPGPAPRPLCATLGALRAPRSTHRPPQGGRPARGQAPSLRSLAAAGTLTLRPRETFEWASRRWAAVAPLKPEQLPSDIRPLPRQGRVVGPTAVASSPLWAKLPRPTCTAIAPRRRALAQISRANTSCNVATPRIAALRIRLHPARRRTTPLPLQRCNSTRVGRALPDPRRRLTT